MFTVVMAGGSGTRFWPASRKAKPKQLLALTGQRSLLQQTVARMTPLCPAKRVLVVTGLGHAQAVVEQLPQVPAAQILAEPAPRNTAAAVGLAAHWAAQRDPQAVCLVLPADHLITDESLFLETLGRAARLAKESDTLVTLGLAPRFPATGFGYIETGQVEDANPPQVCLVKAFHEKPNLATAQQYLAGGRHLWNSGMFAWRAGVLLDEMARHLPELARGLDEIRPHLGTERQAQVLAEVYPSLPSISVDHGILEKSDRLRVVRADFGWSDVGSWEAMADLWPQDQDQNVCLDGEVLAIEAQGNIVSAGGRLAALLGVRDMVAVVTDDVLLILPKSRCQDVRQVIAALEAGGQHQYL